MPRGKSGPHANGRSPMANEVAKTEAQGSAVEPKKPDPNKLPQNATQPGTGKLAKEFKGDLSEETDASIYEAALGAHIENTELLRKQNAWSDYVMCVMNAQREALIGLGKKGTLEEMVGTPVNRTHFRGIVKVLMAQAKKHGHSTVPLDISVPPKDESLAVLDRTLNGGAAMITKQEEIKSAPPKFVSEGVGLPKFTKHSRHNPELFAAAKARAEKLLAAPAQ